MIQGQLCEDLWVEKEADAKDLEQGITGFAGRTAGHCSWDPVSKKQVAGSERETGMQVLLSHARRLEV